MRVAAPDGQVREYFAEGRQRQRSAGQADAGAWAASIATTVRRTRLGPRRSGLLTRRWGRNSSARRFRFIRREAVRALRAEYPDQDAALDGHRTGHPWGYRRQRAKLDEAALRQAVAVSQAIYRTNIFPSMKITWGTYPDRVGHTTSQGCFRCHDDSHRDERGESARSGLRDVPLDRIDVTAAVQFANLQAQPHDHQQDRHQ